MNRPAPVEITYKNMRFLITHNPTNATLNKFIEVMIIKVAHFEVVACCSLNIREFCSVCLFGFQRNLHYRVSLSQYHLGFCRGILILIGPVALLVPFRQHKSLTNDVIAKFLRELSKRI